MTSTLDERSRPVRGPRRISRGLLTAALAGLSALSAPACGGGTDGGPPHIPEFEGRLRDPRRGAARVPVVVGELPARPGQPPPSADGDAEGGSDGGASGAAGTGVSDAGVSDTGAAAPEAAANDDAG